MMALIVAPAPCSIAMICACLVPARALVRAAETAATGAGRFGDLGLAVFTVRERAAVLSLDFVLVMGSS